MIDLYTLPPGVQRVAHHTGDWGDKHNGCFLLMSNVNVREVLRVIASSYPGDGGWDHLSVSLEHRIPVWLEMDFCKRLFMGPEAVAYQLHVPAADHINRHPHVLHIWRPWAREIPLPPKEYV